MCAHVQWSSQQYRSGFQPLQPFLPFPSPSDNNFNSFYCSPRFHRCKLLPRAKSWICDEYVCKVTIKPHAWSNNQIMQSDRKTASLFSAALRIAVSLSAERFVTSHTAMLVRVVQFHVKYLIFKVPILCLFLHLAFAFFASFALYWLMLRCASFSASFMCFQSSVQKGLKP